MILFRRMLNCWVSAMHSPKGRLVMPPESKIIEHIGVGAFWVEEHWGSPLHRTLRFPTLHTIIRIGPGFTTKRKTYGHPWVPLSPSLHNLVAVVTLTEEVPDAE